jgi:hypothetical protein
MALSSKEQVVFREYPIWFWLTGVMAIAVAWIYDLTGRSWTGLVTILVGVAFIALTPILSVTVDRGKRTLNIRYRSLLRFSKKTYSFSEIADISVAEDREGERMYRVELILWSAPKVPLRRTYSVGRKRKERIAQRLKSAISRS